MSKSSNDPMASYTFDTLSYAKELIAAGMPQQQAEVTPPAHLRTGYQDRYRRDTARYETHGRGSAANH